MVHKLTLPPHPGELLEETTFEDNSLIIIGANGSGKTRFGAWIEQHDERVHRIAAQRSLVFGDTIEVKSLEESQSLLLYGQKKNSATGRKTQKRRWSVNGLDINYNTTMLNDYKYVLSALLAKYNYENEKIVEDIKQNHEQIKTMPERVTEKLIKIWSSVFPHRNILLKDAKITAELHNNKYSAQEMSDGERVVLYLIAQALAVPEGEVIIIDEPELHLHRSIMNRLWYAIENERKDCLFVYITHDTQFAAQHIGGKKIWVKSYDGLQWDYEYIEESQLPEQLLLDLLGNRQPVIFVEGKQDSFDTKLYSLIFKNFYIIPCESCDSVITRTKAMQKTTQLHELECYGIIDRDYRSEREIEKLKEDNIYALEVAEVENLFLVPEVLKIVGKAMSFTSDKASEILTEVQNYIIDERFKNEMNGQILRAVISEIKYKLSIVNLSPKVDDIKNKLDHTIKETIGYDELYQEKSELFNNALKDKNYKAILKIFNNKKLGECIGRYWGLHNDKFFDYILRNAANGELADEFLDAISLYTRKKDIMSAHQDGLDSARKSEDVSVNDFQA